MKIVINTCIGGFGVNDFGMELINSYKLCEGKSGVSRYLDLERTDKELIKVVEQFGNLVDGLSSELKVVEIPDDVKWQIEEYDGDEWISEVHRTWS